MSIAVDSCLRLTGLRRLSGEVTVNGAKNAALPCLAAALLTDEPSRITRVPNIEDVRRLIDILAFVGVEAEFSSGEVVINPVSACDGVLPNSLASALRASFLIMGPALARTGKASCGAPGGDVIGARPLDVHLAGFRALGAKIETVGGRTIAEAPHGLRGATMVLDYPSVLGTENLLLAAVLAKGRSRIVNAAMEPEISCLADMLNGMGARVSGAGQHTITIDGVERLSGADHELIPDRIETGTLLISAVATRGDVRLLGVRPEHNEALLGKLAEIGAGVGRGEDQIEVRVDADAVLQATNLQALPYPGFATDLQAPITALLTQVHGTSIRPRARLREPHAAPRRAAQVRRQHHRRRRSARDHRTDAVHGGAGAGKRHTCDRRSNRCGAGGQGREPHLRRRAPGARLRRLAGTVARAGRGH